MAKYTNYRKMDIQRPLSKASSKINADKDVGNKIVAARNNSSEGKRLISNIADSVTRWLFNSLEGQYESKVDS